VNKNDVERIELAASQCKVSVLIAGCLMEYDVRVAGGTGDIETGKLLIIKRCQCPRAFYNFKYNNIGLFPNSAVYFSLFYHKSINFVMLTVVFMSILQIKLIF
jgi:hypothetical protein